MTANKVLDDAVLAVQRDMDATGIAGRLGFDTPAWDDHGYLRVEYKGQYSSHGLHAGEEHEPVAALALIADLAQAVIAEQDWKAWPTCPAHSLGLHPEQASGAALWRCKGGGGHTVAAIGELQRRGRPVARLPTDDLRQPGRDPPWCPGLSTLTQPSPTPRLTTRGRIQGANYLLRAGERDPFAVSKPACSGFVSKSAQSRSG